MREGQTSVRTCYLSNFARILIPLLFPPAALQAQLTFYGGALAGVSTLSADGQTQIDSTRAAASSYKPLNGPAVNLFAGLHLSNYFGVQGNYVFNRNAVTMSAIDGASVYEQRRGSRQHAIVADALLYFRPRASWVRPYLSGGIGAVHLASTADAAGVVRGLPAIPPSRFSSTAAGFRVAVGIDIRVASKVFFRYSFSETIRANEFSRQLRPRGERNLANFQNLFGFGVSF
jgi:hypothetical protein